MLSRSQALRKTSVFLRHSAVSSKRPSLERSQRRSVLSSRSALLGTTVLRSAIIWASSVFAARRSPRVCEDEGGIWDTRGVWGRENHGEREPTKDVLRSACAEDALRLRSHASAPSATTAAHVNFATHKTVFGKVEKGRRIQRRVTSRCLTARLSPTFTKRTPGDHRDKLRGGTLGVGPSCAGLYTALERVCREPRRPLRVVIWGARRIGDAARIRYEISTEEGKLDLYSV
uniref:Uncharacterized protein n=1 Tax=Steinernema glaseri TaxID=37863 RepID=A0A1I8A4T3_9BILA